MAVTRNAYKGIRGDRFRFMMDHMPEQARTLEKQGRMDEYLDETELRFKRRWVELSDKEEERTKRSKAYQTAGWMEQVNMIREADDRTYDQAYREVIEAL